MTEAELKFIIANLLKLKTDTRRSLLKRLYEIDNDATLEKIEKLDPDLIKSLFAGPAPSMGSKCPTCGR